MKPILESCNIHIVGSWNIRIFEPKWVAEKIFGKGKFDVEMGIGPATYLLRFHDDELIIAPQEDRIIITFKSLSDKILNRAEETVIKILTLLTHTPIKAFGINFTFLEKEPENGLTKIFDISDNVYINDISNVLIKKTEINRKIEENNNLINLKISFEDGNFSVVFNFHSDVKNAIEATEKIKGKVIKNKNTAFKYLKDIYKIEIDDEV